MPGWQQRFPPDLRNVERDYYLHADKVTAWENVMLAWRGGARTA